MGSMVSRTLSIHQEHEVLLKLEAAGLNDELAQRVINSKGNALAAKVVRLINNRGFLPTTSQKRAREIMGQNFFGAVDAIRHFKLNPPHAQVEALYEVPFSEAALEDARDTHILVAVFSMSILDIRGRVVRELFHDHKDAWYNKEYFAKERGEAGWHLVRKTPVPDSYVKTWDEQQILLGKDEVTPSARVLVYTIMGHSLATGELLFENVNVRTSSVSSGGHRVCVGPYRQHGLHITYFWRGDNGTGSIGVSSARKFLALVS